MSKSRHANTVKVHDAKRQRKPDFDSKDSLVDEVLSSPNRIDVTDVLLESAKDGEITEVRKWEAMLLPGSLDANQNNAPVHSSEDEPDLRWRPISEGTAVQFNIVEDELDLGWLPKCEAGKAVF